MQDIVRSQYHSLLFCSLSIAVNKCVSRLENVSTRAMLKKRLKSLHCGSSFMDGCKVHPRRKSYLKHGDPR